MTNADLYLILRRHAGHGGVRIITRADGSVALLCGDCNQIVMSADRPGAAPERDPAR